VSEAYIKTENVGRTLIMQTTTGSAKLSGEVLSSSPVTSVQHLAAVDTLNGVKNPNWRDQIRNFRNACTPCTGLRTVFEPEYYSAGYSYTTTVSPNVTSFGESFGHYGLQTPSLGSVPGSVVTEVHNRCIRKFIAACNAARSSVESGQDIGEWRQSYESIIKPLGYMRELINGHYGRLKKAAQEHWRSNSSRRKFLADSYLEFTFGWKPLAEDINDGVHGLLNRFRFENVVPVNAKASAPYAGTSGDHFPSGTLINCSFKRKSVSTYKERMKGAVKVNLVHGSIPVTDVLQLSTVQDFAVTAWDLVPYSFLIDYFVNVGDIISAATFAYTNLAWGVATTRNTTEDSYSVNVVPDFLHNPALVRYRESFVQGGNSKCHTTSFTRNALTPGQLIPDIRFHLPTSAKPWVNIAALVLGGSLPLVPFFKR
jgi:hypothetical protein